MDTQMLEQLRGSTVVDPASDKVGKVEEIYLDEQTNQPEWALVNTGLFGTKSNFVPLKGAQPEQDALRVQFAKDQVTDAPSIEPDRELSVSEEQELYAYYGLDYSMKGSDTGLPEGQGGSEGTVGQDTSGPTTDNAMTRSEEQLRVGTTQQETGRVRLRKHVVTENVTQTVPVQREEIRIEREPITDANVDSATDGPAISEEEHEVTLHAEVPVVQKQAVPVERVRLDKDVVTDEETVSEQVRKEEIDLDESGR
ncbi:MAG TPA: PRC and DUF2382 domain-containing protein [Egibacteraceae bacterium]|nr:PRC and DUF2382 domain-containing protein [Egibacteraceae bacterium]